MIAAVVFIALCAPQTEGKITAPPPELKLNAFYKKCVLAQGIPVVSSEKTSDAALLIAREFVMIMIKKRPEIVKPMMERKLRIAIMAASEQTLDIPEHSDLQKAFPQTDWNKRARGLGATEERPCVSGAEENIIGLPGDRYKGESILIHEFGHTILNFGIEAVDPKFKGRLRTVYQAALKSGVWKNTYAASNIEEYWAEGVQSWFDANQKGPVGGNGIHNELWNRASLEKADPEFAKLLSEVFVDNWHWQPHKTIGSK